MEIMDVKLAKVGMTILNKEKDMKTIEEAVIVAYGRSAIARSGKKGTLRNTHPIEYGAQVLKGVLAKVPALNPELIEDLIIGCAKPELSMRQNIGKLIALRAELPDSVAGETVNRFCASSLETVAIAANRIMTGQAEVIVAGGVESMTAIPYMGIGEERFKDTWLDENVPGAYIGMGLTAENVAERFGVTRQATEDFAAESQRRAAIAQANGFFAKDIIPVDALDDDGNVHVFDKDECIREGTTAEKLAGLKPTFKENGIVTAGTSSSTSDGASMIVLMSRKKAEELGITPLAKFISYAVAGVDPNYMGIGPVKAVPKALGLVDLTVEDMDVIELNEAFGAQALPCIEKLGLDTEKVNPNGGAIALGHPLGATGGILVGKALSELREKGKKYGMVTMCVGGGMGAAGIFESI